MKRVSSRVRPLLIVNNPPFIADKAMATGAIGIVEHVRAIGSQRQLEQRPGPAASRLDEREEAAGRQIETFQRALDEVDDLADEPMLLDARTASRRSTAPDRHSPSSEDDRSDQRLVHPQTQQRVIELSKRSKRPETVAGSEDAVWSRPARAHRGPRSVRSATRFCRSKSTRTDEYCQRPGSICFAIRPERYARTPDGPIGTSRKFPSPPCHAIAELARWKDCVDQPPLDRPLSLHAFGDGCKDVRQIASDSSLVHDARQATSAREHGEQRRLRKADRGIPVIDQDDLVARQRELVSATRADAVQGREKLQPAVAARVFHREPRLVREFAEIDLRGVGGASKHEDVRARAEDALLQARDDDRAHLGVFEADPLDGIRQLDVDPQIVPSSASTGSRAGDRRLP